MLTSEWTIDGSQGETIYGTTHEPSGKTRGVVLLAHGFKGYKDYGMLPWIATKLSSEGFIVHRFNFSHSGMGASDGPFERIDLFEQATWNTQVEDLKILVDTFSKPDCSLLLCGHSRGGVASLLAVGRGTVNADGVITLSSPSDCISMSQQNQQELLREGRIESPSGRTGQMLYVGKTFLEEQLKEQEKHDLLQLGTSFGIPCLIIHGKDDPTVPVSAAIALELAIPDATIALIEGGDHVYNTPNPFSVDGIPSPQLADVWSAMQSWLKRQ